MVKYGRNNLQLFIGYFMKILIPNSFCFAAIGIIKALKRLSKYDTFIIGTGEEPYGLASGSKLTDKYFVSPQLSDVENYSKFLISLIKEQHIELVFCVLDSDLSVLNKIKKHVAITYVDPGEDIISLFSDKLKASLEVNKLGILIPEIFIYSPTGPLICRKRTSVGSRGIHKLELDKITNFNYNDFFVQKFISGKEYTVDILADAYGNPHLIIPRERLEIRNGLSFKTKIVKHQKIIDTSIKICNEFKIPGLLNIQFIEDSSGLFFIELNPRFAGAGITGIISSFNYLDYYMGHFMFNEPIPPLHELQNKIAWDSIITRYYEEL